MGFISSYKIGLKGLDYSDEHIIMIHIQKKSQREYVYIYIYIYIKLLRKIKLEIYVLLQILHYRINLFFSILCKTHEHLQRGYFFLGDFLTGGFPVVDLGQYLENSDS